MIEPIVIRFATAGIPEVNSALARVSTQVAKFEESMVGSSERGGRARVSQADKEAREKIRAYQKVDKEVEKAQRAATKVEEREAKRRADIIRRSSEMAGRDAVRAAAEEAREKERLEERVLRAKIRAGEQAVRAAARQAAEEMQAREKAALGVTKYAKTWGSRIGGAASMVGMTAGIGGAFALADAGRKEFADERNAAQLVNLVTSNGKVPAGANIKNILAHAGAVSKETGVDRSDIVEASKTYAKNAQHGDFAGVMGNMGIFAKIAKVTGSDISQIAEAAGTLQSQNPDLDPAAMKQMLLDANEMSKQGKMSFSESLAQMGKVGSSRSSYGGNVADNQRTLIGFAQLAKSAGTSEEVGTFVSALAAESTVADTKYFKDSEKRLGKGHGKHLFKTDQFGRIANPDTLIEDVLRNTQGNIGAIKGLMGRRGGALFGEVEQSYINAAGKGNDVEAGIRGVKAYMGEVTGTRGTEEGLNAQFAQTMSAPAEKFGASMNRLEEEMKERLAPALEKFADKLADPQTEKSIDSLIDGITGLANFLVDLGPYKGIAAVIGARIGADILQAKVGSGVAKVLTDVIKGSISDKMLAGLNIATASLIIGSLLHPAGSGATEDVVSTADLTSQGVEAGTVDAKSPVVEQQRQALLKRKAELEKEVAHPTGPLGETVARGARAVINPVANFFGLDIFEKQLADVTKSLQTLEKAAKTAAPAVQGIPSISSGAPGQPIGNDSRAKSG